MKAADIVEILNDEKAWLVNQPGMQPWDQGCRRVVALLQDCLQQYAEEVREASAAQSDADRPAFLGRLWRCLAYHWRDAAAASTDGHAHVEQVAREIAAGHGYRAGGKLGGNPLRDVVLAVAMVRKDQRAPHVFQEDYYPFACGLAAKMRPPCWASIRAK